MHLFFLNEAIKEAKKASKNNEVPVGAIIVKDNNIIARAHNKKETTNIPTAHAEILVIEKAAKKLKVWRLNGCSLYVTLEPCCMCLGAIVHSRIENIYYGTSDTKSGACGGKINLLNLELFNHKPKIHNLKNEECSILLKDFFKNKRN